MSSEQIRVIVLIVVHPCEVLLLSLATSVGDRVKGRERLRTIRCEKE